MNSAVLIPYLTFDRTTREAMTFYRSILGGELTMQTFGDSGMPCEEDEKNLIIHADLKNGALSFMASDGGSTHPVHMGDNISMSISGSDLETLTKYFNSLAERGEIKMPLAKQFWGDTYGQLTDKFGVNWMINIHTEEER